MTEWVYRADSCLPVSIIEVKNDAYLEPQLRNSAEQLYFLTSMQ